MNGNRRPPILPALAWLLLVAGGPVRAESPLNTPTLVWAARSGQTHVAELLIARGADPAQTDHLGNSPLHLAMDYPAVVKLLLEKGAPVEARNVFGQTPLHLGVRNREVVQLLLAAGADPRALDFFHKTALDYSVWNGTDPYNLSIVEILIQAGGQREQGGGP